LYQRPRVMGHHITLKYHHHLVIVRITSICFSKVNCRFKLQFCSSVGDTINHLDEAVLLHRPKPHTTLFCWVRVLSIRVLSATSYTYVKLFSKNINQNN